MENNLYYTPTIEEFHVGFEYEEMIKNSPFRQDTDVFAKRIFSNRIANRTDELTCIDYDLGSGGYNVRVKYLDSSDIESLGWIDGKQRGITPFIFNEMDPNNEFQLYYQFDNQFAQIYNCHSDYAFQGTIKNKSELIKLMQQLNIK